VKGNNGKIVLTVSVVAIFSILLKLAIDIALLRVFGATIANTLLVLAVFLLAAYIIDGRYRAILRPEIRKCIDTI